MATQYTIGEMRSEAARLYREVTEAVHAGDRETARHRGYEAQRFEARADQLAKAGRDSGPLYDIDDVMVEVAPSAIGIDVAEFMAQVDQHDKPVKNPCYVCGRHVTPARAKEAEFALGGHVLILQGEADPFGSGYLGVHPVGSDCYRRMMRWVEDHRS